MQFALQYLRFGAVGLAATLTHALLFVVLMETVRIPALGANLAAFSIAVIVSFLGHCHWTFRETNGRRSYPREQIKSMFRFVMVAMLGLVLNSSAVFLIVDVLDLSYYYAAIVMIGLVPVAIFTISKHWAFS